MDNKLFQEQIERRKRRGLEEIVKITNKGNHPIYSSFEVGSTSERIYSVVIRSLNERVNSCDCPDYRTNTIGTCKHIEGVLSNLQKNFGNRFDEFIAQAPATAQVFVHYAQKTTIRTNLPFPKTKEINDLFARYFDLDGIFQGKILMFLPVFLDEIKELPQEQKSMIHIDPDVYSYLKNIKDIELVQQQKNWFLEQVKRGNRSLNILSTPLYGYQEQGVLFLTFGRRALLADDMGLGKTIQAIAAATLLKQLRDIKHALIVTPASLKHQWAREINKFTSLPMQVIEGPQISRRKLYDELTFFNIINYETLRHDHEAITKKEFDLVILDEAQRIKNWRTKTANVVKRLKSPYTFVLTGTPLENRLDELFSIFQFIEPTVLGPLWKFNEDFYEVEKRISGSYKVLGYKNMDILRARIAPYVLRRLKEQVQLELPERIDNNYFVEMTKPQLDAYEEFENKVARLMALAQKRPLTPDEHNILMGALVKMRLICDALILHEQEIELNECVKTSPKLRELEEILSEGFSNNGHKALIFSQWSSMLFLVEFILKKLGIKWVKLTGDVPSNKRGALIEEFFENSECRIFLSTDAGGVGLNLQAASTVINMDLPWNPAVLNQRISRAHRHGQRLPVNVINLIAKDTIEERILDTLSAKKAIFDAAFSEDSTVVDLSMKDVGQSVLQRLEVLLLKKTVETPELVLEPTQEATVEAAPEETKPLQKPALQDFAGKLVARYPGRILVVRKSPEIPGAGACGSLLVVVDRDPSLLRQDIEKILADHFNGFETPNLMMMEQEGYKTFSMFARELLKHQTQQEEDALYFKADSVVDSAKVETQKKLEHRITCSRKFLDESTRKLRFASLALEGGFPEEVLLPLQKSFAAALMAHISLVRDEIKADAIPTAGTIEKELVATKRIPEILAARIERVRALTSIAHDTESDESPLPGVDSCKELINTVNDLIDLGQELLVREAL